MSACLIAKIDVKNPTAYEEYKAKVPAIVRRHGGEFLVLIRGGNFVNIEGNWKSGRFVVIRMPDVVSAHAMFNDPECEPLKALRKRICETHIVFAEGS